MDIYLMRHGTTVWNKKGITQGRVNNRLSQSGKAIAEQRALELQNVDFDVIFASPLMRTMQTANIINKFHKNKIIKDERLTEIDQGIFSGKHKDSYTEADSILRANRDKSCGMESFEELFDRCKSFADFLLSQTKYQTVLIVTHNAVASYLERILNNIPYSKETYFKHTFKNAEVKIINK